jgi:hypothetical protein
VARYYYKEETIISNKTRKRYIEAGYLNTKRDWPASP